MRIENYLLVFTRRKEIMLTARLAPLVYSCIEENARFLWLNHKFLFPEAPATNLDLFLPKKLRFPKKPICKTFLIL